MTGQKRIQKETESRRKRQQEETAETLQGGDDQTEQVAEGLEAAGDVIDDILADIIPMEGATEIIGAPKERPQLREISAEEFIRAFRQQTGQ